MRINTNVSSLNAWRNLSSTDNTMSKNLERLSSGYRINRAGDDVAGLAISENMRAQIKGLNQAIKNAQDGISLLQTAEGSLNEVHTMLHRMRELSVQSANGTLQPEDRKQIQTEMDNLAKEVTRITNATQFNSMDLIDGSLTKGAIRDVSLQIGPNGGQTVEFEIGAMDSKSLGIGRDVMTARVYTDDATTGESVDGGNIVSGVAASGAVGAGFEAGEYEVRYNASNQTVQLFEYNKNSSNWESVGKQTSVLVDPSNPSTSAQLDKVTIGDTDTAKTLEISLQDLTGDPSSTDKIYIGSRVGTVEDLTAAQEVVDTTGSGTGLSAVGWGMSNDDYEIRVVDADPANPGTTYGVQLYDKNGLAIGNAVEIGAGATQAHTGDSVTIGDAATGRTLSFTLKDQALTTGSDMVKVTNNGQAAEDAKFDGGSKYAQSQAFAGLNVSSVEGAKNAISAIDAAIGKVSYQRSQLGAITNRLEHTINNLQVVSENLTASESRIRDVDMALEMTQFTKQQILMQSGTAMLAQANQKNQAVLQLLR